MNGQRGGRWCSTGTFRRSTSFHGPLVWRQPVRARGVPKASATTWTTEDRRISFRLIYNTYLFSFDFPAPIDFAPSSASSLRMEETLHSLSLPRQDEPFPRCADAASALFERFGPKLCSCDGASDGIGHRLRAGGGRGLRVAAGRS